MSFMQVTASKWDGIEVKYREARRTEDTPVPAGVDVHLDNDQSHAWLRLSIEDARALAEQLPRILMLHDAAERLADEKAVA